MGVKMTEIEKKDWNELCEYVKKDILGYDNDIKIPKFLILRLKGLKDGKFICNNKIKSLANYTYYEILTAFKANKILIKSSILPVSKFKDEQHRINYIMAIIENKINDVALRVREIKLSENKSSNVEINICNNKAKYIQKTKEVKNSRLKGLL